MSCDNEGLIPKFGKCKVESFPRNRTQVLTFEKNWIGYSKGYNGAAFRISETHSTTKRNKIVEAPGIFEYENVGEYLHV